LSAYSNNSQTQRGSKRFSIADTVQVKSKRKDDQWKKFDDDTIFAIDEIPDEFLTDQKFKNYTLAKQEECEQKLVLDSAPFHFEIEPTNICNLRCPLCSTGVDAKTRQKGILTFNNFKKIINQIKNTALIVSLQNWGEPTLVKDLPKMIKYATDAGIFLRMSTNFSIDYDDEFLIEFMKSGLGRLVIDIDGTTQDVYAKYRVNGNLETVLENTRKIVKIKKDNNLIYPIIQARMLVMKHNEHQIDDFKQLSKKLQVDEMEFGNIQLNPNTASDEWLPTDGNFVYETYLGKRIDTPCHWPWTGMVINSDGGVSSCAIVDDNLSDFGNVFEEKISDIWNNESYTSARTTWTKNARRSKTVICNICKNDTHNPNLLRVGDTFSLTLNRSQTKNP